MCVYAAATQRLGDTEIPLMAFFFFGIYFNHMNERISWMKLMTHNSV